MNNKSTEILTRKLKAYDFAIEIVKQYTNLSIFIITITITFMKDIIINLSCGGKVLLIAIIILHFSSLVCGMFAIKKHTTEMEPDYEIELSIEQGFAPIMASIQIILFYIALILSMVLGFIIIFS